jgi:hypothetical protein
VHTSRFFTVPDEPEFPAAAVLAAPALAPVADALAALALVGADASVADFDPAEQAVTDAAARVRLAAARTAATLMSSPGEFLKRG